MSEEEFLERYNEEKSMYKKFGEYIREIVIKQLRTQVDICSFLKIPVDIRLKDEKSLINKAFYRGKKYQNPYEDITDKVGLRFVVLLAKDIEIIKDVLINETSWTVSIDRDYEEEREAFPDVFTYQSVHCILYNKEDRIIDNINVQQGITCEIQIRTLLQHSYSELTHDRVYKNKTVTKPEVNRKIARSMALIETTDQIFEEVDEAISKNDEMYNQYSKALKRIYKIMIPHVDESTNNMEITILDAYQDSLSTEMLQEVEKYFANSLKFTIYKRIIEKRYNKMVIFQNPVILLVGYMLEDNPIRTLKNWPFLKDKIEEIANAFGISLDVYE